MLDWCGLGFWKDDGLGVGKYYLSKAKEERRTTFMRVWKLMKVWRYYPKGREEEKNYFYESMKVLAKEERRTPLI